MSLAAYRSLWRAARLAFQGDRPILTAAQVQIRDSFRQNSALSSADVPAAVQHAQDVAKILRENVVQGQRSSPEESTYKLRIHEHTERGDNESILTAGKNAGGKCGCN